MKKGNFKKWLIASLVRAVRTFAEVILATIGTNYVRFNEVDWIGALSIGWYGVQGGFGGRGFSGVRFTLL